MDPQDDSGFPEDRFASSSPAQVYRMGEVLEELFAQVQRRWPELRLTRAEPPTAVGA